MRCHETTTLALATLLWAAVGLPLGQCGEKPVQFNVRNYGAAGDGKALETAVIGRAIEACAQSGGGTVVFPAGEYVTGTFVLLSHVTLHLEAGAVIIGSRNLSDYGYKSNYLARGQSGQSGEGLRTGIIVARKAEQIAITGHGVIDGQGTFFVDANTPHYGEPPDFDKRYTRQGDDFMNPRFGVADGPVRPRMAWSDRPGTLIILADCTNVLVRDVTLRDSHNWTLNITGGDNVAVLGVAVLNNLLIPNNDGVNINARNARISDCNIRAGDDAIAANGCENLAVANCTLVSRSSAIRFGGGRHCSFQNLVVRDSNRGIGIYGSANSVLFSDILIQTRLHTGHWWGKAEPIYVSVRQSSGPSGQAPIKDVRFSNILADSESGILVYGTEGKLIQNLSFDRIKLRIRAGPNSDAVGGNFDLRGLGGGVATAIFKHDIPGFYCQYVDGLQIHGLEVEWGDNLPDYFSDGIRCEHFSNLMIDGFTGRQAQQPPTGAAIALSEGRSVSIRNCTAAQGTGTFLSLRKVTDQRMFTANDLGNARQAPEPSRMDFKTVLGNSQPAAPGADR